MWTVIFFWLQHSEVVHKTFEMLKEKIASYVPEPTPAPEAIDSPLLSVPVPTPMPMSSWVLWRKIALYDPEACPTHSLPWGTAEAEIQASLMRFQGCQRKRPKKKDRPCWDGKVEPMNVGRQCVKS